MPEPDKPPPACFSTQIAANTEEAINHESANNTPENGLVYRSDFYASSDNWFVGEKRDGKIGTFCRDGYYHIVLRLSNWWHWFSPAIRLANFRVYVDAEFTRHSVSSAHCGVVFRARNDNEHSFYYFRILRSGHYALQIYANEEWKVILNERFSDLIRTGDNTNSLMVEMVNKKITLGINGHILDTVMDNNLVYGYVGLLVGTGNNDSFADSFAEARFRNFRLYAIEQ